MTSKEPVDPVNEQPPADALRAALRKVPSPLALLLLHDGQEVRGATVGSFMAAAVDPPTLVVSLGKGRWMHAPLHDGGRCTLNLLSAGQEHVADHFASAPQREGGVHAIRLASTQSGVPRCPGSMVTFECAVSRCRNIGDQTVVDLTVESVLLPDEEGAEPLLWRDGAYAYLDA